MYQHLRCANYARLIRVCLSSARWNNSLRASSRHRVHYYLEGRRRGASPASGGAKNNVALRAAVMLTLLPAKMCLLIAAPTDLKLRK